MKESTTYQEIVEEGVVKGRAEGRAEGMRSLLLALGEDKFGPADDQSRAALSAIDDIERLEELGKRVLRVGSWQELLAQPAPRRRNGRRKSGH